MLPLSPSRHRTRLPNAQEKRKREKGQATKDKNFVEEEKRLQREFGMYSGFD
jgi:hypothetical protein